MSAQPTTATVTVITARAGLERRTITVTLGVLEQLVGSPIQWLPVCPGVHAYLNEEGKVCGLAHNHIADMVLHALNPNLDPSDYIVGDVVVVGEDSTGEDADLPEWVHEVIERAATWLHCRPELV